GFLKDWTGLAACCLERHGSGNLERHFGRVYLVVRTIYDGDANVHNGVAREHAAVQGLFYARLDSRDVLSRNGASDDLVDEFEALPRFQRIDLQLTVAVLAAAARLTLIGLASNCFAGDGLPVC